MIAARTFDGVGQSATPELVDFDCSDVHVVAGCETCWSLKRLCPKHQIQVDAMGDDRSDRFEPKRIAAQGRLAREKDLVWRRIDERLKVETQSAAADEPRRTTKGNNDEQG